MAARLFLILAQKSERRLRLRSV